MRSRASRADGRGGLARRSSQTGAADATSRRRASRASARVFSGHGLVGLIAIAMDDAAIAFEQSAAMNGPTARCIGIDDARWIGFRPKAGHPATAPRSSRFWSCRAPDPIPAPGVSSTQLRGGEKSARETLIERFNLLGGIADPEGERGTVDARYRASPASAPDDKAANANDTWRRSHARRAARWAVRP